ncbi:transglycosylase domain-containing protein [Streptomyces somaliensis]|uniref:Penicillin-binding protein n=1 Tax=Streptomyces somaliensis (strain ATCC 33201 / DSM 40738 / JCM 12659 / KCTC 9044 / NCTC 11332 / NRRL B-12077 / IP 733) TaxID=1134445 RepID=A0AA44DG15_STRE0|nr:transglycosylase domain-containing protein [Streptomyces somaliensis]NKY15765.1 penicillin-binding protein [Streptomyces somaliensis DSM 40738]
MSDVPPAPHPPLRDRPRTRTRPAKRRRAVPTRRTVLRGLLLTALLLGGGFLAGYHLIEIPPANAAATAQANVYLYADGSPLAQAGRVNRESVPLDRVPRPLRQAVLAAEDRDFYTEPGVDPGALLRASWNTVTGKGTQGGSTITQQYVKNYYLGQERTVTRKVKEFFIAVKLDRAKPKDEILEGYLNTSYYGRNAYGAQAAAQAYYGKDVQELDTAESAYLASLLNAPSAYDVGTRPSNRARALARWNYVLDAMVQEGWLTAARRSVLRFPEVLPSHPTAGLAGQRGYAVQAVNAFLARHGILSEKELAAGGYRITTTLRKDRMDAFDEAVRQQVLDRLDPEANPADRYVRVGGASIEPATGKVVALYGGVDYTRQYVNNATRRDYQVGSTFKPFVLASAVAYGATTQYGEPITPNTVYDGTNKRPVEGWTGKAYAPANEDDVSYGGIPLHTATDRSVNAVYAQLAVDVGPKKVRRTAISLGLPADTPDLTASPSIALGPATASVLDMAEAYATLANHGRRGLYTLVEKVERIDPDGDRPLPLPAAGSDARQAVSREAADTTTAVLRGVVEGGTGTAARAAGRPAAGKTGTAEDDKAAWFAGYTPDLATVVALMGQDPKTGAQKPLYGAMGLARVNGGGAPAEVWAHYTGTALEGTPPRDFDLALPEGSRIEEDRRPEEPTEEADTEYATGRVTDDRPPQPPRDPSLPAPATVPDGTPATG